MDSLLAANPEIPGEPLRAAHRQPPRTLLRMRDGLVVTPVNLPRPSRKPRRPIRWRRSRTIRSSSAPWRSSAPKSSRPNAYGMEGSSYNPNSSRSRRVSGRALSRRRSAIFFPPTPAAKPRCHSPPSRSHKPRRETAAAPAAAPASAPGRETRSGRSDHEKPAFGSLICRGKSALRIAPSPRSRRFGRSRASRRIQRLPAV